jgi:hypothetical protein
MAFGFFDAPRTALLAAGVAGGAIVGVRSFVPWQERKDVYAMGEEAIVCAVTALSFGTVDKTTEESSGATGATPQPVAGGASSAAAPLGHEAVRLRSLSTNLLSLAGTVDPRPGEPQPVAADLTGRIEKQTDLTPQLKSMAARASARGPAEAFLVNRLVIRYEDLKTSLVKASASVAAVETTISHADVKRADRLDKALAAIRSAINSQVNGLGFQPNLALQAAGDHVNPYLQRIAGQIGEARAAVRQADTRGKETTSSANAVAGTVAQGGEAGVVEEAAAIGQKTQQQAAQGSSILRSTLSIISVPSACGGGLVAPAPDTSAEDNGEGDS